MRMSVPCQCHSSISVGDEPLAKSELKFMERHYRRGKRFSSASCKMRVWKLKPYGSTGIFARQSRNDGVAPKGVRGQQRTGNHVPLSLLKSSQMQARPLVSRPLFSVQ